MKDLWRKIKEKSDSSEARWVLIFGYIFAISAKALGYLRYLFISYFFGASAEMDVFWMVYSIGGFIPSIAHIALDVGAIPVLKEVEIKEGKIAAYNLMGRINKFMILGGILLISAYPFIIPQIIEKVAVGFSEEQKRLITPFLLLMLPFFFMILLKGACEVWAICRERYILAEKAQIPANAISIAVLIVLNLFSLSPFWVAISLDLSIALLVLFMILWLKPYPMFEKKKVHGLRKIAKLSTAAIASSGASIIYSITDKAFASLLPAGSITAITFAEATLTNLIGPVGNLFSKISIGKLSKDAVEKRKEDIKTKFYKSVSLISFYIIPFSIFLWISSPLILSILFKHGKFTQESLAQTIRAFKGYLIGIPWSYISMFLIRYIQAVQKPFKRIPLAYASAGLNAFLDWLLVFPLREFGLTLATSCVQITMALIYHTLFGKAINLRLSKTIKTLSKGYILGGALLVSTEPLKALTTNEILLSIASFLLLISLWILTEKLNLFPDLPEEWGPTHFLKKLLSLSS